MKLDDIIETAKEFKTYTQLLESHIARKKHVSIMELAERVVEIGKEHGATDEKIDMELDVLAMQLSILIDCNRIVIDDEGVIYSMESMQ